MVVFPILDLAKEAIWILIKVSSPIVLTAMLVGLIISILQAATQINEVTLTFVPKIIAVFFAILLSVSFIGSTLNDFFIYLLEAMKKI